MTKSFRWIVFGAAAALGLGLTVPAWAQTDTTPASTSMHAAGSSMKAAGSNTWAATKDTYHAGKTAIRDTDITTKVKYALHKDPLTHESDIDVHTTAGVVTLEGKIPSRETAYRAERLAMATEGVRRVRNKMVVISAAAPSGEYSSRDYRDETTGDNTVPSSRRVPDTTPE